MFKKSMLLFCLLVTVSGAADDSGIGYKQMRRKLRYVEEFYRLYTRNQLESTGATERSLFYLQYALNSPYIHPIQALCEIKTPRQHEKYKILLRVRIAFLLAKGFVRLGWRYDKEDIYYFNRVYSDELAKGFKIARHYYKEALVYWKEALRVAALVDDYGRTRLAGAEIEAIYDEARRIRHGMIDYAKVINFRLQDLDRKEKKLNSSDNSVDGQP